MVGDAFLRDTFPVFQQLKKQTLEAKSVRPYLYDYYNITPLYSPVVSTTKSVVGRVHNEIIGQLNKKDKLPRYIVMLFDKDIIEDIDFDEFGVGQFFYDQLNWFANSVETALDLRKEDLKYKNPGSLWSNAEPRLIYVEMITRPIITNAYKPVVFAQGRKFNETIHEIASYYKHSHVMNLSFPDDKTLFDRNGNLTPNGKVILWHEVIITMRAFDRNKIDLKPFPPKRDAVIKQTPRDGQGDAPKHRSQSHDSSHQSSYKSSYNSSQTQSHKSSRHNSKYHYRK